MKQTQRGKPRRTGITHHPLETEKANQKRVPPRGKAKQASGPATAVGGRGHRLSRRQGDPPRVKSDTKLARKSTKVGKARKPRTG